MLATITVNVEALVLVQHAAGDTFTNDVENSPGPECVVRSSLGHLKAQTVAGACESACVQFIELRTGSVSESFNYH